MFLGVIETCNPANNEWECCTATNQCDVGQGDCDSDSDCKAGLKCGSNNCKVKTGLDWDSKDDCCFNPG